jgi:CelD/BcsL family acetyltransferase involved in cellulose biosynthesis
VTSHVADLSGGYCAYQAERKAAGVGLIKDCDRKRRRVEREVAEPVFTAFSRSEAAFDQLIAWKRAQFRATGQTDIFSAGWTLGLLKQLFASRDPDFGAVLFTLHFGDRLAAVQLNLRGRRTIHAWIIAHDPELERHSPGLLLFQDILRWMDETPFDRLDLGPGEVRFKRELANDGVSIAHGFVGLPSTATLTRAAVYEVRRAVESLPLGPVSELPGKAMRRLDQWRGLRGS